MTPFTTIAYVKAFENRCNIMGWNTGAQNVTKFPNQAKIMIDIVKNYGQIAEETSSFVARPSARQEVHVFRHARLKTTT